MLASTALVEHKCSTSIHSTVSAGKAAGRAEGSFRANILLVKMYLQDSFSAVYSVALCGVPHGVRATPDLMLQCAFVGHSG